MFFKKNICNKYGLKKKFKFIFNRTNFELFYKNNIIFNCSYKKALDILKSINLLFYGLIINDTYIKHVDDKKDYLSKISVCILNKIDYNDNFLNFLLYIENNISNLYIYEITNKQFILKVGTYLFIKNVNKL